MLLQAAPRPPAALYPFIFLIFLVCCVPTVGAVTEDDPSTSSSAPASTFGKVLKFVVGTAAGLFGFNMGQAKNKRKLVVILPCIALMNMQK